MSSLSSVETKLPPGFRFHPRDEELICDYLMKWITRCSHPLPMLIEVDLNKCEPWDIPDVACVGGKEWYFYSQRDRKYATGMRTNRATVSGYWKATGKDRPITRKGILVGMRKTLVFYQGRAPKGRKSDWVMHEFRLEGPGPKPESPVVKDDWVLCRVFFKSRSETPPKTQETTSSSMNQAISSSSPVSLPPLIAMTQGGTTDLYHEQVPCFSIFNQTNPTFSLLTTPPEMMEPTIMPSFGPAETYSSFPLIVNSSDNDYYNDMNCEKKMIKAVLNHITKREMSNDQEMSMKGGSPSFGEGSSDSYLSEVGLCSMWNNQYS